MLAPAAMSRNASQAHAYTRVGVETGVDGALTTRTDGLGQQLQRNQKDQDALQVRLDGIEKRMRAQYTALDATMALLNSRSNYITQQIAAFNANSSSK